VSGKYGNERFCRAKVLNLKEMSEMIRIAGGHFLRQVTTGCNGIALPGKVRLRSGIRQISDKATESQTGEERTTHPFAEDAKGLATPELSVGSSVVIPGLLAHHSLTAGRKKVKNKACI
jgi:hypothetical protein